MEQPTSDIDEEVVAETVDTPAAQEEADLFQSPFFQQSNVPQEEPVTPKLVAEQEDGKITVIQPSLAPQPRQSAKTAPVSSITVTDNGETDYDDDQKFDELVNRPAWQSAIQNSRIVDVQTPAMMKTVQPAYTTQSVFFGLGATNAD